jgi:hypothetical protein
MGEVSKFAGGDRPKRLKGRELGEIDSVKKVSMLVDYRGEKEKLEPRTHEPRNLSGLVNTNERLP